MGVFLNDQSFLKHREMVAREFGQWVGLLNENGELILEAPRLIQLSAPKTRNAVTSVEAVFSVRDDAGRVHPIVDELIASDLENLIGEGYMTPEAEKTRFLAVHRNENLRVYRITHTTAEGSGEYPETISVHGVSMLHVLEDLPSFSDPVNVSGVWQDLTFGWRGPDYPFEKTRRVAELSIVDDSVNHMVTREGPADQVILETIQASLQVVFTKLIPTSSPVLVDPKLSGKPSPNVLLRPSDNSLMEDVLPLAESAGITLEAEMWFPGDAHIEGLDLYLPTIVIKVIQG